MEVTNWFHTKNALSKLLELLKCGKCDNTLVEPCSFSLCNHYFCKPCAQELFNNDAKCRHCDVVLWREHMQVSLKIPEVLTICNKLQNTIYADESKNKQAVIGEQKESPMEIVGGREEHINGSHTYEFAPLSHQSEHDVDEDGNQYNQDDEQHYMHADDELMHVSNSHGKEKDVPIKEIKQKSDYLGEQNNVSTKSDKGYVEQAGGINTVEVEFIKSNVDNNFSDENKKAANINSNLHLPLNFTSIHSKPENKDRKSLDTMLSIPSSQFSNALSDIEVENGAQRNPRGLTKRPKVQYSKNLKLSKKETTNKDFHRKNGTKTLPEKTFRSPSSKDEFAVFDFLNGNAMSGIEEDNRSGLENDQGKNFEQNVEKKEKKLRKRKTRITPAKKTPKKTSIMETRTECTTPSFEGTKDKAKTTRDEKTIIKKKKILNLKKRNQKGETPLHTACIKGNYELAKELLEQGAESNTKDNAGWTPLHEACNHGRLSIAELLLDHDAIIDMVGGEDNDTPLHDAVSNNRPQVVSLLLQRGAPTNVRNRVGLLPIDYAITQDMKQAFKDVKMLELDASVIEIPIHEKSAANVPKMFVTTNLNSAEKNTVEKCLKKFGCELVKEYTSNVTHVICGIDKNGLCKSRTIKYMYGLISGKWVLSYPWIRDSFEQNEWLNEVDYEIKGVSGSLGFAPKRSRVNCFKSLPKLFDGCSFYFSGTFDKSLSKDKLIELTKLGGGKILSREPKTSNADPLITPISPALSKLKLLPKHTSPSVIYHARETSAQACCSEYIIYDPKMNPGHKKISSPILCTAPTSWLLDCVSNFEIIDVRDEHESKEGMRSSQT